MSDMYTRLASSVLFPVHERLKGHHSVAMRHQLELSQWLDPNSLEALQHRRLREFLINIGQRVPYYRELFRAVGFDPGALTTTRDLQVLPLLTKSDIRQHGDRLKAEGHGPLAPYNTGGSSGQPLTFYIGKNRKSHDVAAKWRATRWWGVDIGDTEAVIWGSPIEHGVQDRVRQLRDRLMRSTLLPAFEMSEQKLDDFVSWIRRRRPRMLFGYPSALAYIARHAEKRGIDLSCSGVKVAFVTSERLYEDQRVAIERCFGCPVANGYGSRDAGFIAHECPARGMHISAEDIVVEILGADGEPAAPGAIGEIVVTNLATEDFPFLRYRTGDIGAIGAGSCSCGRGLPLLTSLQGRSTDFVVAADGTVMHGLALIYVLRSVPGIEGFKVTQETRTLIRVDIVPVSQLEASQTASIVQGFKQRLGESVDVQVKSVEAIAPEASGKYRYIVSRAIPP